MLRLCPALTFTVLLFCSLLSFAQAMPAPTPDKKAGEFFKNVQVLKDVPSDQLIRDAIHYFVIGSPVRVLPRGKSLR
jgi:hypothetical protein